ncbi:thioredoxin family protein [Candidatus Woesearchaeota archaeon]|nr:thioredoxin family protein [Candidatus Woesearchaeota archaeon]
MALMQSNMQLEKGAKAPGFSLRNVVDDKVVKLSDFNGKPVLVIFMCNHCPYVKPKLEEIGRLGKEYLGKVAVVGISSNDPKTVAEDGPEEMKKVAAKFGLRYYLFDEAQEAARAYGATCTPDPFLFDKEHTLVFHGRLNDALNPDDTPKKHVMREKIDAMLAGKKIDEWFLPSMGCSIKWKTMI